MRDNKTISQPDDHPYVIASIKYERDSIKIETQNGELTTSYRVSLNDYLELGYKKNDGLTQEEIIILERKHLYHFAHEKCIKKLSANDKTEKEIRMLLDDYKGLGKEETEKIIASLKSAGYLSDKSVVESQLYLDQNKLFGKRKTRSVLKNRGVEEKVIDEVLAGAPASEEKERGIEKASKLFSKIKDKSFREKVQYVRNRLIADGYEDVDGIINGCLYEKNEDEELSVLKTIAEKTNRKYKLKYSGKQLYINDYRYLLAKGFDSDDIKNVLQDMEVKNED